jgi:hypothetical protein
MSSPVNHHFVPIFYLDRWTGSDGKVVVYVRKGGRVVNSRLSPRSTGFEPELYSLAGVDGLKRQAIETEFFSKQIDNRAALVLMELVDQRVGYLSDADRVIFSHFLISLRARHPGAVEKARRDGAVELRRHLDLNPEEYERIRTANDPATLAEVAERFLPVRTANFGLNVLQSVIAHPEVGERLFRARWSVINFTFDHEARPLLTSDRPCLLEGNLISGAFAVYLPISPTKLFLACDSEATEARLRQLTAEVFLDRVNRTVVTTASNFVYGLDDQHLSLVEQVFSRCAA